MEFGRKGNARPKSEKKIYMLHSDVLSYNIDKNRDAQILHGHVKFLHDRVYMYCDSAYFYQANNSFEAFGHVRMIQGDTLSLAGDYLYYDGTEQMAKVRKHVILKHRKSVLKTDSLDYDRLYQLGYFFEGGTLYDKQNVLTSDWGQYSPSTREAVFNYNVKLVNPKFVLKSDTLHYETKTQMAHITGPSNIDSGDNHIYTESGWYDTNHDRARLNNRPIISNKGKKMVGDSVFYDSKRSRGEAFKNVVYTDEINKNMLTGDYCYYDDLRGYAMATRKAVARDFSQKDTLYMHADTFKLFTFHNKTDSAYRIIKGYTKVRAYRADFQAVCDTLTYNSKDSCIALVGNPIVWNGNQQLLGEKIHVFMNDSTIKWAHIIDQALSVERIDSVHYNQINGREMKAFFVKGELHESQSIGNVQAIYYTYDSDSLMIGMNYTETNELHIFLKDRKMSKMWTPAATSTMYPLVLIPLDKMYLPNFAWFDYIRPLNKDDIFDWRGKKTGTELKNIVHSDVPLQDLNKIKNHKKK
jgi:lipopolysaccharide export system protein LptA